MVNNDNDNDNGAFLQDSIRSSLSNASSSASSFDVQLLAQSDPGVVDVVAETTTSAKDASTPLNRQQLAKLEEFGFTNGLSKALYTDLMTFSLRLWMADDYHTKCETPWEETKNSVAQFGRLAHVMGLSTNVHSLRADDEDHGDKVQTERLPLTQRLVQVQDWIPTSCDGKVALVIATDAMPDKLERQEFCQVLEGASNLWIVFRLCSDDSRVVNFYKHLDKLYNHVEVLDDYVSEAKEVFQYNPWLNYSLAWHRLREVGFLSSGGNALNLLDERPLTKWEICDVCCLLFGVDDDFDGMSEASGMDWEKFVDHVGRLAENEEQQWSPIAREFMSVVSLPKLKRHGKRQLFEMCTGCTSRIEWNLH